jgi:hypothetical protein
MTIRKKPPVRYVPPEVGKICNSNTRGFYSTPRDSAMQPERPGADSIQGLPSRHGDRLHYRDGRVTDMAGTKIQHRK